MEINNSNVNSIQASRAALVKQARVWVSQTFFGTLLKQMHDSPFRSEIFSGGRGGQAFSSLFNQHLTERMAGGNDNGVESALGLLVLGLVVGVYAEGSRSRPGQV